MEGSGRDTIQPGSGSGGTGTAAGRMDASAGDAATTRRDAAVLDAGKQDAGKQDAGAPECTPEGRERACGSDVGACVSGKQLCKNGAWGACGGGVTPADETCDGSDNDCDDATDEGCPCGAGEMRSCGTDVGTCELGVQACENGNWGGCQGDVAPGVESCATPLDEDCDGTANEGCACEDGATQACGSDVGECVQGVATCAAGQWGACVGETSAKNEACDGEDDDCDGATDEGCPCTGGASQPCGTDVGECAAGTQTCLAGAWGPCEGGAPPADETCDAQDDDCDGASDEGGNACGGVCTLAPAVGTPCDGGDGDQCDDDAYTCDGANAVLCPTGATESEICNGQDDDCVGGCDDTFTCCQGATTGCTTGCGTSGTETCAADCTWGACAPPAESCNGTDDDCDGPTDEGFGLCTTCCDAAGDADQCNDDQVTCAGCEDVGGDVVETCNGTDDDCDGPSDEGFGLCTACCDSMLDADQCNDDQVTCAGCQDVGGDVVETCNGTDDDCDGPIDEGFGLCTTCCDAAGDADQCNDDQVTCNGCQDVGGDVVEACNGTDDDCDGPSDEDFGLCTTCCDAVADADKCNDDQVTCNGCEDVGGAIVETCNDLDDDCDGPIDEDFGLCSGCCDSPDDADLCDDDDLTCAGCVETGGAVVETCNGLDDDCDGPADEDFPPQPLIPPGITLFFDSACPSGWTAAAGQTGRFTMGHDNAMPFGESGGAVHTHTMAHTHTTSTDGYSVHQHNVTSIGTTPDTVQASVQSCDRALPTACACGQCDQPVGSHSHSLPAGGILSGLNGGGAHAHTVTGSPATGPALDLPAWRETNFCVKDGVELTAIVPTAAIAMFRQGCAPGWAEDETFRDRFLRDSDGDFVYDEVGGSDSHGHSGAHSHGGATNSADGAHSHSSGGTTGNALATHNRFYSLGGAAGSHNHAVAPYGSVPHTHNVTTEFPSVTSDVAIPLFREMIFCKAVGPACNATSQGMVGLFDWSCPAGWAELVAYRNLLLRGHDGDAVFQEGGGTATHTHTVGGHGLVITTSAAHTHAFTTTPLTWPPVFPELVLTGSCSTCYTWATHGHTHGGSMSSAGTHTHTVSAGADFATASASNNPPWREHVLCEKQ